MTDFCGLCNQGFPDEAAYVAHTCSVTGFTPADPQHQGADFQAISEAALKRGFDSAPPAEQAKIVAEAQAALPPDAPKDAPLEARGDPGSLDAAFVGAPTIVVDPETAAVTVTPAPSADATVPVLTPVDPTVA